MANSCVYLIQGAMGDVFYFHITVIKKWNHKLCLSRYILAADGINKN